MSDSAVGRTVDVVGAVVVRDGLVLCAQRGPGSFKGLWEFPGGKVEPGESREVALVREVAEELGCEVAVGELITTTVVPVGSVLVSLSTFWCELMAGEPVVSEHNELRWLPAAELASLEWAPADVPAVELVAERLGFSSGGARGGGPVAAIRGGLA